MSLIETIYKLFGISQDEKILINLQEIKEHLSKQIEKAVIQVREVEISDLDKKKEDSTYLADELLKYTENGISILLATEKLSEELKKYIPRTVKELTIPSTFLNDLSFLQEFPNLESLNISDYSFFPIEALIFIEENTSIKNISFRSASTINNVKGKKGFNIIEAGNIICQYKDLTLYQEGYKGEWKSNIKIYATEFDQKALDIIEALYERIHTYLPPISEVSLGKTYQILYQTEFELSAKEGQIKELNIKNVSPTEAATVYKYIIKKVPVETTKITLENQTYDDINQLKQMDKTSNLTIKYKNKDKDFLVEATYDEFQSMRATIDYYKELIETSELSPAEKVAYVYDILKTMRYKENKEDKNRPRNIHSIVTDGTIVCVGYSEFARELLTELGLKCINVSVTCYDEKNKERGHQRNFVRIDDDKYNIHGLFAMDITWDNDKDISIIEEEGEKTVIALPDEEQQEKVIDKYDSLVLYRHFLIPMETYELRYPNEKNPKLYELYKAGKAKDLVDEARKFAAGEIKRGDVKDSLVLDQHEILFDNKEGHLTVERYFNEKKPSLETFEQILNTVRKAQGYTTDEAEYEVGRVVELHKMLNEQNLDSSNHFFKPSTK